MTSGFSFQISDDLTYSYSHDIKIKFVTGSAASGSLNPIGAAQLLAQNLINSKPQLGFANYTSGYYTQPGKRTYNEATNLITNEYSVVENFKLLRSISGSYAINFINSLEINEAGITNVREAGKVQVLVADQYNNYYPAALSGMLYEVNNNSFNRCNNVFQNYQSSTSYPLNSKRLSFKQVLNKYIDTVDYDVAYTNSPAFNS